MCIVHTGLLPHTHPLSRSLRRTHAKQQQQPGTIEPNKCDTCALLCVHSMHFAPNESKKKYDGDDGDDNDDEFNAFRYQALSSYADHDTTQQRGIFITKLWHESRVLVHPLKWCT